MKYITNDNGPVDQLMGTLMDFDKDKIKKGKNRNGRQFMFLEQPVSKTVYWLLCNWRQELEKSNEIYDKC